MARSLSALVAASIRVQSVVGNGANPHGCSLGLTLKIRHTTTYRFHKLVSLWPHRLMLRPRESRDLRLIFINVMVTPAAVVTWANDIFGNEVATATFQTMSTELVIDSVAELQLESVAWPVFDIAASAISYPFRYSNDEWIDLGAWRFRNILMKRVDCGPGRDSSSGAIPPMRLRFSKT